jgi:hypothetical protein
MREAADAVSLQPIIVAEPLADFLDRRFDRQLFLGEFKIHQGAAGFSSAFAGGSSAPGLEPFANSAPIQKVLKILVWELIFTCRNLNGQ